MDCIEKKEKPPVYSGGLQGFGGFFFVLWFWVCFCLLVFLIVNSRKSLQTKPAREVLPGISTSVLVVSPRPEAIASPLAISAIRQGQGGLNQGSFSCL